MGKTEFFTLFLYLWSITRGWGYPAKPKVIQILHMHSLTARMKLSLPPPVLTGEMNFKISVKVKDFNKRPSYKQRNIKTR